MSSAPPRLAWLLRITPIVVALPMPACGGAATPAPTTPAPTTATLSLTAPPPPPATRTVRGTLHVSGENGADTSLTPAVVLLRRIGRSNSPITAVRTVRVTSSTDLFDPPFTAVGIGDTVVFVNRGGLQHSFFSPDLEADLGSQVVIPVAAAGQYASVDFITEGPKRIYCSLHPDEAFTVFVSATQFYAVPAADGSYDIGDVPVGRYRLTLWSNEISGMIRDIKVDSRWSGVANIRIDLGKNR